MRPKRLFLMLGVVLLFSLFATALYAANTLTIVGGKGDAGSTGNVVSIELTNTDVVGGLQFTITDNPNVLTATAANPVNRAVGFTVSPSDNGTSVTVLVFNLTGGTIAAGSGAILEILYDVAAGAADGEVALEFSNVTLSDAGGNPLSVTPVNGTFTVGAPAAKKTAHEDPPYLQIQSAEHPITIDGRLDETDWKRRFDHLVFRSKFTPGDVEYAVTSEVEVQAPYTDTTTTIVKILHYGLDLYLSLQSNDHSVCKFDGSWEGDGLFMKIKDAQGNLVEYKLFFNHAGYNPDVHFEVPGMYPGSGEGAAWKHPSTIVNDNTAPDSGYTGEMVIHLDKLGYTDPYADIPVLLNIFDPDGYTGAEGWEGGAYHKMWWGSEWGPETRTLRLADPPSRIAIKTDVTLTLDGQLNESFWASADSVVIAKGSHLSTAGYYMQWGNPANSYTDSSAAVVKFAHKGTDLYVGVQSNDASVCKWSPGWEADGLFLWMTYKGQIPQPWERLEIKAMYFNPTQGSSISFETNANIPTGSTAGASYEPSGTVTHTETNGPDAGYSIEVVVHTDMFGYSDGDTVKLSACIWDLDYASADAYDPDVSDYHPNWWGTQWADANFEKYYMYRDVILSAKTGVDDGDGKPATVVKDFRLEQNYPNPFNPATIIRYHLPKSITVKIEVFNILGSKVATLVDKKHSAGAHSVVWDGKDQAGNAVGSGIYYYKISSPEFSQTKKMVLIK